MFHFAHPYAIWDSSVRAPLSIKELAGVALPTGECEGLFVVLRAYFDDSGTHASSVIAVMGGLIGTIEQWEFFERAWAKKLACPLPGKSPLKMFHLSHCNAGDHEFLGYTRAEQDAVIHDFRKIIIDARLTSLATAVDRRAWDELIVGPLRKVLGTPLSACFTECLMETVRIANPHPHGEKIAVVFDRGIETKELRDVGELFSLPLGRPRIASVNFVRVEDVLPLQGADIVATENYWHAIERLKLGDAALPRPHFRHYLANMLHEGLILDRDAIAGEMKRRDREGYLLEG